MIHKFCRRCGGQLRANEQGIMSCQLGHHHFGGPIPGAHLYLVDDDNNVLMVERAFDPGKGKLGAIGGFSKPGETAEETAVRETEEESGLTPSDYGPLNFLCTATNSYNYQGEIRSVLAIAFWAKLKPTHAKATPADDAGNIFSLPIANIDLEKIAGDDSKAGLIHLKAELRL